MKKTRIILLVLVLNACASAISFAQMPFVYNSENTGADCKKPNLLPFDKLPVIEALPDPFSWSDGRGQITKKDDWKCRRAEIAAEIQNYEIGTKPVRPRSIASQGVGLSNYCIIFY